MNKIYRIGRQGNLDMRNLKEGREIFWMGLIRLRGLGGGGLGHF
jgi:hypothetical protein